MNRRRGKSLIEVLVMMSLFAAALAASTTTLAALFRIERLIRRDIEQAAVLDRLSQRLRADAHAAVSCSAAGRCELTLADGREIRYAFASPVVTREVHGGGKLVHRDGFYLPLGATVRFETEPEASGTLIRLSVSPAEMPGAYSPPIQSATILSAINPNTDSIQRGPAR